MSASGIARSTKRSALPPMNTNSRPPSERMSGVTYGRPGCATMSGSVTSGVGEGWTVGEGRGDAPATGDARAGSCEGAGGVWEGASHADRTAAARRIATFISRPTLSLGRSCEESAAGRLWAGVARSMPLRFFRRVRIAKGLTLNLSKRGASLSAGRRGARVTFGRRGARATAGVPGTGVSYTSRLGCLLPAALVIVALLTACAPAGDGPIAGQAGARSTNAPTSAPPGARSNAPVPSPVSPVVPTVAPLSTPTPPITPPTPRLTTVPPVPAVPTLAPAPLQTLAPPTLAPPTLPPPTVAPALPTVAPALPPAAGVAFTFVKSPVAPNGTGQVTVATAPNAACTIVVTYKSGPSMAQGLVPKVADGNGSVNWTWNIGPNTTA